MGQRTMRHCSHIGQIPVRQQWEMCTTQFVEQSDRVRHWVDTGQILARYVLVHDLVTSESGLVWTQQNE
jgi:hypothetical protein